METYLTLNSDIGIQPLVSVADSDGFRGRQEHEMIQELRKQAISHWLKQLPLPDENEKQETMWPGCQSFGSRYEMQTEWGSRDFNDGRDFPPPSPPFEQTEESPVAQFEKKSMPAENEEFPVRGLESVKGQDMMLQRRLSEATAFREPQPSLDLPEQFSKKWNIDSESTVQETADLGRHALPSVEEDVSVHSAEEHQSAGQEEAVSAEGDWSVMSECLDASVKQEDTAYGGSADGSGKERRFHLKYEVTRSVFAPPPSQCIAPRTSTPPRPFTPADLRASAVGIPASVAAGSSGEWWSPSMFFKGLVGMVCNVGLMVDGDTESVQSCKSDAGAEMSAANERVMRRLSHRKAHAMRHRSARQKLCPVRLRMRMQQEKRHQDRKRREVVCQLQHPQGMRLMAPLESQMSLQPLSPPPEIRAPEYQPPLSVTDLSDFESFLGPLHCAVLQEEISARDHTGLGQCQTWLWENLWCFLGGKPRLA